MIRKQLTTFLLAISLASVTINAFADQAAQTYEKVLKAAKQGDAVSQDYIGTMYRDAKYYTEAVTWFTKAADQGLAAGQSHLAYMLETGKGIARDDAKAIELYTKAANQGRAAAQNNLAEMYETGRGVAQDYAKAIELYTQAANQGFVYALYDLGEMYFYGKGVAKDHVKANEWYKKYIKWLITSANKGYSGNQADLGAMYYYGKGVPQDYAKAIEWFTKSANQGNPWGQYSLGTMYESGEGVTQDYAKAIEWYTKSANQGNSDAQNKLGYLYDSGKGAPQDYAKAFEWSTKAANQGYSDAQNRLGEMYENGKGVPQDYAKAFEWYTKACDNNNEAYCLSSKRVKVNSKFVSPIDFDGSEAQKKAVTEYIELLSKYYSETEISLRNSSYDEMLIAFNKLVDAKDKTLLKKSVKDMCAPDQISCDYSAILEEYEYWYSIEQKHIKIQEKSFKEDILERYKFNIDPIHVNNSMEAFNELMLVAKDDQVLDSAIDNSCKQNNNKTCNYRSILTYYKKEAEKIKTETKAEKKQ